jgi:hypothetical protein
MGALGSIVLALAKRRLDRNPARFNFTMVQQAVESTAKLSAFVIFILLGARVFSLTFYGVNGHIWVEHLMTSLPGGQVGFLIFVNTLVFLLAFFLDFFELAFIIVPLLGPVADKLGIDLVWFGVMLAVNMQTSFMHPPFGFALFFLRSVAPKVPYLDRITGRQMAPVTTGQIYMGAIPFVVIQLIMVAIVVLYPQIVMHYKTAGTTVDPAAVQRSLDNLSVPGLDLPAQAGRRPSISARRRRSSEARPSRCALGACLGLSGAHAQAPPPGRRSGSRPRAPTRPSTMSRTTSRPVSRSSSGAPCARRWPPPAPSCSRTGTAWSRA